MHGENYFFPQSYRSVLLDTFHQLPVVNPMEELKSQEILVTLTKQTPAFSTQRSVAPRVCILPPLVWLCLSFPAGSWGPRLRPSIHLGRDWCHFPGEKPKPGHFPGSDTVPVSWVKQQAITRVGCLTFLKLILPCSNTWRLVVYKIFV